MFYLTPPPSQAVCDLAGAVAKCEVRFLVTNRAGTFYSQFTEVMTVVRMFYIGCNPSHANSFHDLIIHSKLTLLHGFCNQFLKPSHIVKKQQ